jgi:hypothetical protein
MAALKAGSFLSAAAMRWTACNTVVWSRPKMHADLGQRRLREFPRQRHRHLSRQRAPPLDRIPEQLCLAHLHHTLNRAPAIDQANSRFPQLTHAAPPK